MITSGSRLYIIRSLRQTALPLYRQSIQYAHSQLQTHPASTSSSLPARSSPSSNRPVSAVYPPLNFDDVTRSFQSKSYEDLLRALLVYRICTIRPIVAHATQLLEFSKTVLGDNITAILLKKTFFKQFCAGEDANEIVSVVDQLESQGLGGILDYAAEADVSAAKGGTGHQTTASPSSSYTVSLSHSSDASGSKQTEWAHNTDLFCSSIVAAGQRRDGFAAIKVTAMGDPDLLIHMTDHIIYHKQLFSAIQQQQSQMNEQVIPPIDNTQTITLEALETTIKQYKLSLPTSVKQAILHMMDKYHRTDIDYLLFSDIFSPFSTHANSLIKQSLGSASSSVNDRHVHEFSMLRDRTNRIAQLAKDHQVRLLVDAEQTYLQPAIDLLVFYMQAIANVKNSSSTIPYVYNTYQCYLKDTYARLLNDEARAARDGWVMAAKIVRGAYMRQERQRAAEKHYDDPIQPTFRQTTNHYHTAVQHILTQIASSLSPSTSSSSSSSTASPSSSVPAPGLVIAGHNESTVRWAADLMAQLGIPRASPLVFFGQLLGMCDHVSYSLALSGYRVVKVCPYGPINEVLPYLIRRAQENADVLDRATKERQLVWKELIRRTLPMITSVTNPNKASTM